MILERFDRPIAGIKDFCRDVSGVYVATSVVAILFSCTGPVAIVISVGINGGLTEAEIASWILAGCVSSGAITIWFSLAYRQPLSFAWTIPGTVLLGSAVDHLSFAEVIGAYWATAILVGVVGLSGGVGKALKVIPMQIVMAMVAGIFLQFGLDMVLAFEQELIISAAMVIAFIVVFLIPGLSAAMPPVVVALAAGIVAVLLTGKFSPINESIQWFGIPGLQAPEFSRQALIELVIPLAVTVLVAQNGQGFAVLMNSGHKPPANAMTAACGAGSVFNALFGGVSACVTGPANAVLVSAGETQRQYTAGVLFGIMNMSFGIMAFSATWLILSLPPAFIAVLTGLALLPVLLKSFITAFEGLFQMSALVTLLVTVSEITIWNIGSPFWGLVVGLIVAVLLERDDFQEHLAESRSNSN